MTTIRPEIAAIATKTLHLETLETRRGDSLDFHELAVWQIRDALEAAYQAGLAAAKAPATQTIDLGNNESMSRGVFEQDGAFLAMTFTQSKTFKTRTGAERWLARH